MIKKVDNNQFYTSPYAEGANRTKRVNEETPAFLLDYDDKGVIWERSDSGSQDPTEEAARDKAKNKGSDRDAARKDNKEKRDIYEPSVTYERSTDRAPRESKPEDGFIARAVAAVRDLFRRFMNAVWYGDDEDAVKKNNREAGSQDLTGLFDIGKEGPSAEDITEEMSAYIDDETSDYPEAPEEDDTEEELSDEDVEEELAAYSDEEPDSRRYSVSNHNGKIMIHVGPPEKNADRPTAKDKEASRDALLTYYDKTGRIVKLDGVNTSRILKNKV